MENPLNSGLWLINKIAQKGETLLKGQFISTGTCTNDKTTFSKISKLLFINFS